MTMYLFLVSVPQLLHVYSVNSDVVATLACVYNFALFYTYAVTLFVL